jgi:hypothetical protein
MRSTLLAASAAVALLAGGTAFAQNTQPPGEFGAVGAGKVKGHEADAQTGTTTETKATKTTGGGMQNTSETRSSTQTNGQAAPADATTPADQDMRTRDRDKVKEEAPAASHEATRARDTDNDHDRLRANTTNITMTTAQRTRIREVVRVKSAPRLTNVSFRIGVGERIPRTVTVAVLPPEIVEIAPQWSGFSYFVYGDEIVVIDPMSFAIVGVLPL